MAERINRKGVIVLVMALAGLMLGVSEGLAASL